MKLFTVEQIRQWDAYTIANEPITSVDLMERAAAAFTEWLLRTGLAETHREIFILCGMGNNGGDGLAIARLLHQAGYRPHVYVVRHSERSSDDFNVNLQRYESLASVQWLSDQQALPLSQTSVIIDALLGSGLTRPASGLLAHTIQQINTSKAEVISVDIASGLFADQANGADDVIVQPSHTVSFQVPKLAFLQPKNTLYVGKWHLVDIGLSQAYAEQTPSPYFYTDTRAVPELPDRDSFSNKGTFGHALLMAGSYGKIGAAVLASRSCLRSGVGLLTVQVPQCGYMIIQTSVPEAMCLTDEHETELSQLHELSKYSAVGIGPGMGQSERNQHVLRQFITQAQDIPCVIDADALNMLSQERDLLEQLPPKTILTPHPKEFERLLGKPWKDDYEKLQLLQDFSTRYRVVVVLKGQHTVVASPDGEFHFNSTGNAGMATGGTGDVLTGVLTALLAQKLEPKEAAILGVYRHGEAGDRAAARRGMVALTAGDVIDGLRW
ncbi:bifunctional ADP-dependent NAD(P)H-hydrate dehydratase/NAD(P)H-hydrate epimerase [Siphonobacter sp. BAB-5405]|uniref:NAD(P)H-hydrate dehydratase n=1 Tax=Siphonobacter sp. BAB-5405 TaxID=1864825 RepID=UPI000C80576A|nr:NAD(P)H-hydrate dehydratase [Siphonobacter sp. BAB-5405]PMD94526.1 bifunctional ADP-dependent NAD(P)H-hydrate dehydratase/NAD(P)H-hydrate epimerase [Siphonobacter sp. BAB-5405]